MPKYKAPSHPHCEIECEGPGYATYVEPDGPCLTGCGETSVGRLFADLAERNRWDAKLKITIGMDAHAVEKLAFFVAGARVSEDVRDFARLIERRMSNFKDYDRYKFNRTYKAATPMKILNAVWSSLK
ncbi:hypothetical protein KUW17_18835 [Leisingera aquaemixtae]|uniref:hypothetical protein n=1 Tax=Leisingera aquaemixtae TaxID=1396826 RepID=UPI001C953B7D|nr:hypothetical protein [Leisingera aquaemixtae]MBY6068806.1 hypothetical protein [Leisingera aquaemixtae]